MVAPDFIFLLVREEREKEQGEGDEGPLKAGKLLHPKRMLSMVFLVRTGR